jgi:hypothetical protein
MGLGNILSCLVIPLQGETKGMKIYITGIPFVEMDGMFIFKILWYCRMTIFESNTFLVRVGEKKHFTGLMDILKEYKSQWM